MHSFLRRLTLMIVLLPATILLAADGKGAPEAPAEAVDPLVADHQALQGRWARELRNPQGLVIRIEKTINGDQDSITELDPNGNVIYSHIATFKLSRDGDVRLFTFSNFVVTAGANAGAQRPGQDAFLYRLEGDRFFEVWGLREGERQPPAIVVWQRIKPAPAEK